MGRAPCCEKVGLKRGRWTAAEDEILMRYIQDNGEGSWRSLPKNAGLLRCGKSCRLRWINYLRADVKRGNISPEEEKIIIKLHSSHGNRWSLIAGHLPGRTDNEIKNYWNSHLSRRIHSFRRPNDDSAPIAVDIGKITGGAKRRGGRKSRSAMKKNKPNVEIMRKENPRARSWVHSTTPLPRREALKDISNQTDHKKESIVTGSNLEREVAMAPCEVRPSDDVSGPHDQRRETGLLGLDHMGMDGGTEGRTDERESGVLVFNEEMDWEAIGLAIDERENGGLGSSENDEIIRCDEREMRMEWCSKYSMDVCFEEMGCLKEEWLGWDWDGMEDKQLEEEGGNLWSWLWGSDR